MAAVLKRFKAGDILFRESDPSRSIFIIKKGAVSIRRTKGETFLEIARLKANEVIGELSFFDRLPRSATAVAIIDTEAMEIAFDDMDKIYGNIPDYLKTIMASMADRLRKANDQIRLLRRGEFEDLEDVTETKKPDTKK